MLFFANGRGRRFAGLVVASTLALGAASSWADTVYSTLDATVDATHEEMSLVVGGNTAQTTLKIQIAGKPDHPGCNIQGASHFITLEATSSDPDVATVAFAGDPADSRFDACNETLTVIVTSGNTVGTTTVTFAIDASKSSHDPDMTFSLLEAAFEVTTTEDNGGPGTVCDADPAAPAWANAILKANGVKSRSTIQYAVSSVAQHMTQGAVFEGVAKNAHPDYENAVWEYMTTELELTLPIGPAAAARPDWVCTPVVDA